MLLANQIAGFLNQLFLQKKKLNNLIFCMLMQIHKNQKLIKNLLVGHGQKCVWPIWSLDSKTDCI